VSRNPLFLLEDILQSCGKIIGYTGGRSRDQVFSDGMRFDAILFNLHVIGEAVKQLPRELRDRHSTVAWREIAGMRDIIAHAYFALDLDILWSAVQDDVPELRRQIEEVVEIERKG
jgi:uncharacterized protein with HEPN domain